MKASETHRADPHKFRSPLSDLQKLRDEVRVRLHLAGLEAKSQWDALEAKLNQVESDLTHRGDSAWNSAAEVVLESARAFRSVLIRQTTDGVKRVASDVMTTSVKSCRPSDTLRDAARLMWEGDCGVIPVVDDHSKPVGMITDRDICMAAYFQGNTLSETTVGSAMSHGVHVCSPDDDLPAVEAKLRSLQIRRIPVVDSEGRLIGIVSLADLAQVAAAPVAAAVDPGKTLSAITTPRHQRSEEGGGRSSHGN